MTEQTSIAALIAAIEGVQAAWDDSERGRTLAKAIAAASRLAADATTAMEGLDDVIVTESAGTDGARLIIIDTDGEPFGTDGGRPLRVLINDDVAWAAAPYEHDHAKDDAEAEAADLALIRKYDGN